MTTNRSMVKNLTATAILFSALFSLPSAADDYKWILKMRSEEKRIRQEAARHLAESKNVALAPAMVDMLFYMPRSVRHEMVEILKKLTGDDFGENYYDWVEYVGKRSDLKSPPGYIQYKVALFSLIDPGYRKMLYTGVRVGIRPEEIVWGGVTPDGIPPIDAPVLVESRESGLNKDEKIFGITRKGESRAYPLRYLSWHEMLNDRIAGEPITVSF